MTIRPLKFLVDFICIDQFMRPDKDHLVYFIQVRDQSQTVDSLFAHAENFIPKEWFSIPNPYWYGIRTPNNLDGITEDTLVQLEKYEGEYRRNALMVSESVEIPLKEAVNRYAHLVLTNAPIKFDK